VALSSGADFQEKQELTEIYDQNPSGYSAFSPDARFMARTVPDGSISVWDLRQRVVSNTFKPATKDLIPAAILDEGNRLVVWSKTDNRLFEWNPGVKDPVQSWPVPASMRSLSFSPDNSKFAALTYEAGVQVQNVAEPRSTRPPLEVLEGVDVAFSPSGKLLAVGSDLGYARVWETGSWREEVTLGGYLNGVHAVAFSPDSNRLATGSSSSGEALKLWAVDSWQNVLTLHPDGDYFYGVAFSPDGNTLGLLERNTHVLRLWRAPSWEQIATAEGNGNQVGPR
jgi:WD40 repeat protein